MHIVKRIDRHGDRAGHGGRAGAAAACATIPTARSSPSATTSASRLSSSSPASGTSTRRRGAPRRRPSVSMANKAILLTCLQEGQSRHHQRFPRRGDGQLPAGRPRRRRLIQIRLPRLEGAVPLSAPAAFVGQHAVHGEKTVEKAFVTGKQRRLPVGVEVDDHARLHQGVRALMVRELDPEARERLMVVGGFPHDVLERRLGSEFRHGAYTSVTVPIRGYGTFAANLTTIRSAFPCRWQGFS